jgi:NAD-dependent dihydropyrimidine dehydrogenase PreA subunit
VIRKEGLKKSILSLKNKVRGQNLVEITLIMPIVILLFAGMVEVGFAVYSYVVVSSAAREGARFGSRGVHVPFADIAGIVETSLGKAISTNFSDPEANAKIIVTEVDVEEDGTYKIHWQEAKGIIPVSSSVCDSIVDTCPSGSLDIQKFIEANKSFNNNPDFCVGNLGCDGDFVVVEVVYFHKSVVLSGITRDLIPDPFPIKARAVMRVLSRRAPSSE